MKINLSNIGMIRDASIELEGLTVIAGCNDTGKSTIGKVIYAITQAYNNYPKIVRRNLSESIHSELRHILFQIRRNFDLSQRPEIANLLGSSFRRKIDRDFEEGLYEITQAISKLEDDTDILSKRTLMNSLKKRIERLRINVEEMQKNDGMIYPFIQEVLKSEFHGEITNNNHIGNATITVKDGETTILSLEFDNDNYVIGQHIGEIGFDDSTFIEGPSIMQYSHPIKIMAHSSKLPYHIKDLAEKLTEENIGFAANSINLNDKFVDLFKGKFLFDENEDEFILLRGNQRIRSTNVASGIKALAIIDILTSKGIINRDNLLILDEPETNLHPKWQVELAKTISQLSSAGVKVLVTTHSPYMIEALKIFTENSESKTNFYMATKDNNDNSVYIDCTKDISLIISELSDPLIQILGEDDDI